MGYVKEKNGTFSARIRYKDYKGESRVHKKRGFKSEKEVNVYEAEFLKKLNGTTGMTFASFVDVYKEDVYPSLKKSTQKNKDCVIGTKILPFFGEKMLRDITKMDIVKWQNELLGYTDEEGNHYSPVYLKKIRTTFNAIFNHAENYYGLKDNPVKGVKSMGKDKTKEKDFWTEEEYMCFREAAKEFPEAFYAFETLYWTGMRLGELMGLTKGDIDLISRQIRVSKTFSVIDGEENITSPKTEKSNRSIDIPEVLCDELEDFFATFYKLDSSDRPFHRSKGYYERSFKKITKSAELREIRIHDLRHSHISYLINKGFTAVEIGNRTGQESVKIVYDYAHMYPSKKAEMVSKLQSSMKSMSEKGEETHE